MVARQKVFTWSDGFHAYTVAVTSRAKALAAWGVSRDLFKNGEAIEIEEGADYERALETPGETIKRGLSVDVGKIAPAQPAGPPRPDRKISQKIDRLTQELATLEQDRDAELAKIVAERLSLDTRAETLTKTFEQRRAGLRTRIAEARSKASGT